MNRENSAFPLLANITNTKPTSQFIFASNSMTLCMASDAAAENMNNEVQDNNEYVFKEEIHLTVLKTSLFFAGDGFTVYDCKGQLVFRVDSYGPDTRDRDELVLMDPNGRCLLTVRRKVRTTLTLSFLSLIH